MTHRNPTSRGITRLVAAALVIAATAAVAASMTAPAAASEGVTSTKLADAGWTCFVPPSRPNRIACFNPGVGRPFPGNPDPAPAYHFLSFDLATGDYVENGHLIRADHYRGQRCAPGDNPYVFLAVIGYYECVRAKNA
jgi:hypothetical protein